MKFYLRTLSLATVGYLVVVAAFNAMVDPYDIHRLLVLPGLNQTKPTAGAHSTVSKAYQVVRLAPKVLILGNSRAEVGFDPRHSAWPAEVQPVFNMALPGSGTDVALKYFRHTLQMAQAAGRGSPKQVLWGLDFIDFLDNTVAQAAGTASSAAQPTDLRGLRDRLQSLLTLGALMDSVVTVWAQQDKFAAHLTEQGFNPMHDYEAIAAHEGYHALFKQKSEVYARNFASMAAITPPPVLARARAFADLAALTAECQRLGIDLRLVIYPYHAQFLEAIRLAGLWPAFEAWKLALVAQVEAAAKASGQGAVPIFDFNRYNEWTTEAVPAAGDRRATMSGYWEAGHFKRELGDKVLQRVFGPVAQDDEFGQRLTSSNVQAAIAELREGNTRYQAAAAPDLVPLQDLARAAQRRSLNRVAASKPSHKVP